jgi:hypothetical protein
MARSNFVGTKRAEVIEMRSCRRPTINRAMRNKGEFVKKGIFEPGKETKGIRSVMPDRDSDGTRMIYTVEMSRLVVHVVHSRVHINSFSIA